MISTLIVFNLTFIHHHFKMLLWFLQHNSVARSLSHANMFTLIRNTPVFKSVNNLFDQQNVIMDVPLMSVYD